MLLSETLFNLIVDETAREHYASRSYQQISVLCNRMGLYGLERYFLAAAKEELEHEQAMVEIANDLGPYVKLPNIHDPRDGFDNPKQMFEFALELEMRVNTFISGILAEAQNERNFVVFEFFLPYAKEQRDSIIEIKDILARYDKFIDLNSFDEWVEEEYVKA